VPNRKPDAKETGLAGIRRIKPDPASRLKTYRLSLPMIGISRKLIAMDSLIKKPCLHGPGCHPFRDSSGSRALPSKIGCRLRRCLSTPSPDKSLLPFHLGLPCGCAVVSGFGRFKVRLSPLRCCRISGSSS
jgi:hypothetical protein